MEKIITVLTTEVCVCGGVGQDKPCKEWHGALLHSPPVDLLVQPRMAINTPKGPPGRPQETKTDKSTCTKADMGTAHSFYFIVAKIVLEFKQ